MKKLIDGLDRTVQILLVILLCGILLTTLTQVIWRYVFNAPFMWTEELARDFGIWMVMLGTGLILREQGHLGFEILPESWKPVLRLIADVSVIFFSIALLRPGFRFVAVSFNRESAAIRMPLWILYLAIPVGLVLMLIFSIDALMTNIRTLRNRRKGENS